MPSQAILDSQCFCCYAMKNISQSILVEIWQKERKDWVYYAVKPLIWSPSLLNSSGKFSNIYDTCLVKKPKKEPCAASNVCMLRHFVYTNDWFVYKCVVCLCLSFFAYDK